VDGQPAGKEDLRDLLEANRAQSSVGAAADQGSGAGSGGSSQTLLWLTIALLTVVALLAPTVAARTTRRARWRGVTDPASAVAAAWADVLDAATDVDLAPSPVETPRDLAARLPKRGGLSRERGGHLVELAGWVEQLRYRGRADELPSAGELRFRAEAVRAELVGSLSARDRRLATWWPASGRAAVVRGWNAVTEGLASTSQRLGDRLLRRRRRDGAPSALPSGS
jgi:hypothetical protein